MYSLSGVFYLVHEAMQINWETKLLNARKKRQEQHCLIPVSSKLVQGSYLSPWWGRFGLQVDTPV